MPKFVAKKASDNLEIKLEQDGDDVLIQANDEHIATFDCDWMGLGALA